MPPAATSSPRGMNLLKATSSYSGRAAAANRNGGGGGGGGGATGPKIVFADQLGEPIAENHYEEQLHYSEQAIVPGRGSSNPGGCGCVIA